MNYDLLFEDRININGEYVRVLKNKIDLKASSFEEPIGYKTPNFSSRILELGEIIALNQEIISKNITNLSRKYGFDLEACLNGRILTVYGASVIALMKLRIYKTNLDSGVTVGSVFVDRSSSAEVNEQQKNLFKLFLRYQKYFDLIIFDAYDSDDSLKYLLTSGVLAEEYPLAEIKEVIAKLSLGLNIKFRNFSSCGQIVTKVEKKELEFSIDLICSSEITSSGREIKVIDPVKLTEYGLFISREQAGVLFSNPMVKRHNWYTLQKQSYWRFYYRDTSIIELRIGKILEKFLCMEFYANSLIAWSSGLRTPQGYEVKLRPYLKNEEIINSLFCAFEEFVETLFQLSDINEYEKVVCSFEPELSPYYKDFCSIATSIFDKHRQVAN